MPLANIEEPLEKRAKLSRRLSERSVLRFSERNPKREEASARACFYFLNLPKIKK
jgi:hypothetical protein